MNTNFKTCLFGGFDRQDVMSFIEKTTQETNERISALEMESTSLRERGSELETELSAAQEKYEQTTAELNHARQQIADLKTANASLQLEADEFRAMKDHIAEIEISAHRRTEQFRAEAIARLREIIAGQSAWCSQSAQDCAGLKEHMLCQLQEARARIESMDLGYLAEMSRQLQELSDSFDETQGASTEPAADIPAVPEEDEPVADTQEEEPVCMVAEPVITEPEVSATEDISEDDGAVDDEIVTERIAAVIEEMTAPEEDEPAQKD